MKRTISLLLSSLLGVASLETVASANAYMASANAYTSQVIQSPVTSFITSPVVVALGGALVTNPLNQYASCWSGELNIATNATITGSGVTVTFANGSTNSSNASFTVVAPSMIKGPVLLETFTPSTNKYVWQNTYNGSNYINVTNTSIYQHYNYSADCVVNATNAVSRFLMKGRLTYTVEVNTDIQSKYVIPSYVSGGWTNQAYTNQATTNVNTNTSATLNLLIFNTNNTSWGYISGFTH
jgi:hypothetical protein